MESISILRALTRRPVLLALGVALALAVGLLGTSKPTTAGFATQRVLVDTPSSLVADARAKGATAIVVRATVLADQIESDAMLAAIARRLGVDSDEVGAISSTTATPETETPLAKEALEVTRPVAPYVVSVGLQAGQPILAIQALAPDAPGAARLMEATTAELATAGRRADPARGPVRVDRLGDAQVIVKQAGGGKKKAAIAALLVLVLWCAGLVAVEGLRRRREPLGGASFPAGASLPR
jgi:hypothetical protein